MECAPCDNSILVKNFHHVDVSRVRALCFWRRLTGWERNLLVADTARARNFFFASSPPCQSNFLLVEGWALRRNGKGHLAHRRTKTFQTREQWVQNDFGRPAAHMSGCCWPWWVILADAALLVL